MSEVFEGYERQYCELSANLSRKCNSAAILSDQEQKQQKLSEIKTGIDEADVLIRKMDLEARSLQPSVKVVLLAKLREYKSDLNQLKKEFKRVTSPNANQAAREELLEYGNADALSPLLLSTSPRRLLRNLAHNLKKELYLAEGLRVNDTVVNILVVMAMALAKASAGQRERLAMSVERLNESSERITESRRTILETEELGISILQDLHQQRETLLHSHKKLHGVDDAIDKSKKVLTAMSRRMTKHKWIVGSIIGALIVAVILILYFKLFQS
ncbi:Vesicle transport v-SNARE 12 [Morus notabilis]|uniref:Vesicle transport v-SNARE 12 n=1 Tax=Morus notabilis TaxID=981085 RepID=W9S0B2_9ROSA|nr:Vesicle transport v-SNARE 12 [Morus notabilis]